MPADVLLYDPTLSASQRQGPNAGCPDGYFAQYVPLGTDGSVPVNSFSAVRCRLMPTSYTGEYLGQTDPMSGMPVGAPTDVQPIIAESGQTWQETLSSLNQAVRDTIPQAGFNILLLAAIGVGAFLLLRKA